MTTGQRQFIQSVPALGAAFAVAGPFVLESGGARAQGAAPLKAHFHPKGKAPSKFTREILERAKGTLPFADTRNFEERRKGFLPPMSS